MGEDTVRFVRKQEIFVKNIFLLGRAGQTLTLVLRVRKQLDRSKKKKMLQLSSLTMVNLITL